MTGFDPSTKFPGATYTTCCIDQITAMGSAFGSTPTGDAVFFNSRIVKRVDLTEGDLVNALVLPNYEDKRDTCSYRALRAEVQGSIFDQPLEPAPGSEEEGELETAPFEEEMNDVARYGSKIVDLLTRVEGPLSTKAISDVLEISSMTVSNVCRTLNALGKVARADVYRTMHQTKASLCVWSINTSEFELDIDPKEWR